MMRTRRRVELTVFLLLTVADLVEMLARMEESVEVDGEVTSDMQLLPLQRLKSELLLKERREDVLVVVDEDQQVQDDDVGEEVEEEVLGRRYSLRVSS